MKIVIFLAILCCISVCGCGEMGIDLGTAIQVQQDILTDNEDALEASKCVDVDIFFKSEERLMLEVDTECIKEIIADKIENR